MSKIITVHSFGRAGGRSTIAANLSALLATYGKRVATVDMDFQSPGLQIFFGLPESAIRHTLNDFLGETCRLEESVQDIGAQVGITGGGRLIFIPSTPASGAALQKLRRPEALDRLSVALQDLLVESDLDYLVLDTSPGLTEDTMMAIALSDMVIVMLRPDVYDYQSTAVSIEVARKLQVPRILLTLNATPSDVDRAQAVRDLTDCYNCEVGGVLPSSETLRAIASTSPRLIVLEQPHDPYTEALRSLVEKI